jgi:hypothetical protein
MKFTLNNDHHANRLMNHLLSGLSLFILIYLFADIFYKEHLHGLSYAQMHQTLYGNEELFIEPMPMITLLEALHADTFFAMMVLLTLGAVYGRVGRSYWLRIVLTHMTMFSALLSLAAPLISIFLFEAAIWVWWASFFIWHMGAMLMAFTVLWRLRFP